MTLKVQSLNSLRVGNRIHAAMNKVDMSEASYTLEQQSSHTSLAFTDIPVEGYLFKMDGIQTKGIETWVLVDEEYSSYFLVADSDKFDRQTVLIILQALYSAEEAAYIKGIEKGKLINKNELRKFLGLGDIKREEEY